MSQPFKLFRLQQVDSQLDQARNRLHEIEAILSDHTALQQAQERCKNAENELDQAQKDLRQAEQLVRAQQLKIEQTEASLYGGKIRNPKELQDLQKEALSLKNYKFTLEDRQLDSMLAVEKAETLLLAAQQEYAVVRSQVETQQASLRAEQANLLNRVNELETERQTVISTIEPVDIQLYEHLRQQRRGVAVARVSDNTCSACGSTLTPAQIQAAHSSTQISRCSFCGRILYAG